MKILKTLLYLERGHARANRRRVSPLRSELARAGWDILFWLSLAGFIFFVLLA